MAGLTPGHFFVAPYAPSITGSVNAEGYCAVSIDNIARIAKGLGVEPWKLLKDD
jgi:hypothetical protein